MGRWAGAVIVVTLSGCGYLYAHYSQKVVADVATLQGAVIDTAPLGKPIMVGVAQEIGERSFQVINYTVSYVPGPFELAVPPGTYYVFAFVDENENGQWDPAERAGAYGDERAKQVVAMKGQTLEGLDIRLGARDTQAIRSRIELRSPGEATEGMLAAKLVAGELTTLKDPRFSDESGKLGHWEPIKFMERYGAGVFLLEPYDPKRIPVLFTHGLAGSPQNFEKMIESVDKKRFQVWVVSYPSGLRLEMSARGVATALDRLQQKYRFETLYVVAHSMGGLVSRRAINRIAARTGPQYVKLFVTISTPWGGHGAAGMSLKASPIVVPAWIDMAPGSPFLAKTELPEHLPFHMLFSYVGSKGGDGDVSLESMLRQDVQDRAQSVHGYPENHRSILSADAPLAELNQILASGGAGECNELRARR